MAALRPGSGDAGATESVGPPVPYTRAIAHEAGWRWQIPLQHRVGCGLVFSSRHMSDDEARAKLMRDVGAPPLKEPWLVPFRTGRRLKTWNRNVVSLGLSSGFIEPLESTSIHLAITAVMRLIQMFPRDGIDQSLVDIYNDIGRAEAEHIRDFIILHYHANQRDEPMWKQCREMEVPESLGLRMRAWRERAHAWQLGGGTFPGGFVDARNARTGHRAPAAPPAGAGHVRPGPAPIPGIDQEVDSRGSGADAATTGIHRPLLQVQP